MPQRNCDSCGKSYTAKRASSKFCSDTCRVRNSRGIQAPAAQEEVPGAEVLAEGVLSLEERRATYPVACAVEAELVEAERLETASGQLALALALRVDSRFETGAAVASLARQLDVALEKALRGAVVAADPLDELRLRREQKLNAG